MTKKNTSTPPKMTATEKKNGKSGLKCPKQKTVQRSHFVGVRIISVVFHHIEPVFSIVDGLFVGRVISLVIVCCIENVISIVDDVKHQEKTCLRQPGQPPLE